MAEVVHVVCPDCDSINRIPTERLTETPHCGRCHSPLFVGRPLPLDEKRFALHVSRSDLPILVDFWASWCGPCRAMAPAFEQAAGALEPQVRLVKVNTEEEQGLAARHGIRSVPTLLLFRGEREVARTSGAMDLSRLIAWTRQYL
ncbi:Thioredoxin C-3 [Gammaproteobacteria bacterium]